MNVDQITAQLRKLDVPVHKLDVTKPGTVQWLLDNLRQRNAHKGEAYLSCMEALMEFAKTNNWVKKTKLQELIDHVDQIRANPPEVAEPVKIQSGQDRLKAKIAAGGFKKGEMATFSGTSADTGRFRCDQPNRSNTPKGPTQTGRVSQSRPEWQDFPRTKTPEAQRVTGALAPKPQRPKILFPQGSK